MIISMLFSVSMVMLTVLIASQFSYLAFFGVLLTVIFVLPKE